MIRLSILAVILLQPAAAQPPDAGKRPYQARCVGCHGEDGSGGGHGPNIVDVRRPRATTLEAMRALILKGIPDGGMPAFQISEEEAGVIAAYVMSLKQPAGAAATEAAPGDAVAGERFFAGKGNCASCHMVRGSGGVLGPDLTNIGRDRRPAQIEQALRDPGATPAGAAGRASGPRVPVGPFGDRTEDGGQSVVRQEAQPPGAAAVPETRDDVLPSGGRGQFHDEIGIGRSALHGRERRLPALP